MAGRVYSTRWSAVLERELRRKHSDIVCRRRAAAASPGQPGVRASPGAAYRPTSVPSPRRTPKNPPQRRGWTAFIGDWCLSVLSRVSEFPDSGVIRSSGDRHGCASDSWAKYFNAADRNPSSSWRAGTGYVNTGQFRKTSDLSTAPEWRYRCAG